MKVQDLRRSMSADRTPDDDDDDDDDSDDDDQSMCGLSC